MQETSKLAERIDQIYQEMKPALEGCAYRYKVPNPQETVQEWLSQAYIIADRFDKGELNKKVRLKPEEHSELIDYDADKHGEEVFTRNFKSYLKKCFVNDLIKKYNKRKRQNRLQDKINHQMDSYLQGSSLESLVDQECVSLEDIMNLIELDIKRVSSDISSVLDVVNQKFLEALYNYCQDLKNEFGNFPVVENADCEDNKRFFSEDFKIDMELEVRKHLCRCILQETNPILIKKLGYLIDPDKRGTLQKRLFRYFFEYHNGYPKRLRNRIKNNSL